MMHVEIDGRVITSEATFHGELAQALRLPAYYGANLDALWDVMTTDVERPLHLLWLNSKVSEVAMPEEFRAIVQLMRSVEKQDGEFGWSNRFVLSLV